MTESKCKLIGILSGGRYDTWHDIMRRIYDPSGIAPALHTCAGGNMETKIAEPESERFFSQARETLSDNEVHAGDTIDAYNKRVNNSGISPAITTRPEGFKTAILPVEEVQIEAGKQLRVRKLTERECGRLMGVKDDDITVLEKNQCKSSLYHLFGDSIVTACLMALFAPMVGKKLSQEHIKQIYKGVRYE